VRNDQEHRETQCISERKKNNVHKGAQSVDQILITSTTLSCLYFECLNSGAMRKSFVILHYYEVNFSCVIFESVFFSS